MTTTHSPFSEVGLAPADPILGLTDAFQADKNPDKVNLGVGVYQDGKGKVLSPLDGDRPVRCNAFH